MSQNGNLVKTIEIKDKNGRVIGTKDVVTYAGLLNLGHEEGLKRIETHYLQLPTAANKWTAVVSAEVETKKGVFKSHGDANPENVHTRIAPHIIRMADTRAKARALRDAVNIGVVAIEELELNGKGEAAIHDLPSAGEKTPKASDVPASANDQGNGQRRPRTRTTAAATPQTAPKTNSGGTQGSDQRTGGQQGADSAMTTAQRRYLFRLLSEQGIEGDAAQEHILEMAKTDSINAITKAKASELIERLLAEAKEAVTFP